MTEGEELFFSHYVEYINWRLRRFFRKILVAFVILGLCTFATVLYISHVSAETHKGLCAIKGESQRRAKLGDDFLKDNPGGIPGISIDSLKRSTHNAKQTVSALEDVSCTEAELATQTPKASVTP